MLLSKEGQVLFVDMADEIDNNGVALEPSVYSQAKSASFKRALDSKVYVMSNRVSTTDVMKVTYCCS